MMDPDGFGFDSSVNYFWWSLHTDEFPWCEAGHLITAFEEIEGNACSLSGIEAQKLLLFPANMRRSCWPKMNEERGPEWMNSRNRHCNDEQSGLCQRQGRVIQAGPEMTIVVKRPKWAQWSTCAGKVPAFSTSPGGMSQLTQEKTSVCCVCVHFYFSVGSSCECFVDHPNIQLSSFTLSFTKRM